MKGSRGNPCLRRPKRRNLKLVFLGDTEQQEPNLRLVAYRPENSQVVDRARFVFTESIFGKNGQVIQTAVAVFIGGQEVRVTVPDKRTAQGILT